MNHCHKIQIVSYAIAVTECLMTTWVQCCTVHNKPFPWWNADVSVSIAYLMEIHVWDVVYGVISW